MNRIELELEKNSKEIERIVSKLQKQFRFIEIIEKQSIYKNENFFSFLEPLDSKYKFDNLDSIKKQFIKNNNKLFLEINDKIFSRISNKLVYNKFISFQKKYKLNHQDVFNLILFYYIILKFLQRLNIVKKIDKKFYHYIFKNYNFYFSKENLISDIKKTSNSFCLSYKDNFNYKCDISKILDSIGYRELFSTNCDEFGMGSFGKNNVYLTKKKDFDYTFNSIDLTSEYLFKLFANIDIFIKDKLIQFYKYKENEKFLSKDMTFELDKNFLNKLDDVFENIDEMYIEKFLDNEIKYIKNSNMHKNSTGGSSSGAASSLLFFNRFFSMIKIKKKEFFSIFLKLDNNIISIGTDTGGSIRLPAYLCNLNAYKPTYGILSRSGLVSFSHSYDSIGFIFNSFDSFNNLFLSIIEKQEQMIKEKKSGDEIINKDFFKLLLINYEKYLNKKKQDKISIAYYFHNLSKIKNNLIDFFNKKKYIDKIEKVDLFEFLNLSNDIYTLETYSEAFSNLSRYNNFTFNQSHLEGDKKNWKIDLFKNRNLLQLECKKRYKIGEKICYKFANLLDKCKIKKNEIKKDFQKLFEKYNFIITDIYIEKNIPINNIDNLDRNKTDFFLNFVNIYGLCSTVVKLKKGQEVISFQIVSDSFCDLSLLDFSRLIQKDK